MPLVHIFTCTSGGSSMVSGRSTVVSLHKQVLGAFRRQKLQHMPLSVKGCYVRDRYAWPVV
jgi:hypothetical protein